MRTGHCAETWAFLTEGAYALSSNALTCVLQIFTRAAREQRDGHAASEKGSGTRYTHTHEWYNISLSLSLYIYIDMHVHVHIMQTIVVILLFIICKRILYSYNDVSEKGSGALRIEAHTARFQFGADVVIQVLFYRLPFLIRRVMRKEQYELSPIRNEPN